MYVMKNNSLEKLNLSQFHINVESLTFDILKFIIDYIVQLSQTVVRQH